MIPISDFAVCRMHQVRKITFPASEIHGFRFCCAYCQDIAGIPSCLLASHLQRLPQTFLSPRNLEIGRKEIWLPFHCLFVCWAFSKLWLGFVRLLPLIDPLVPEQ